jgi:tripartite-type tricarboxylate transporter receptor subunit TctC
MWLSKKYLAAIPLWFLAVGVAHGQTASHTNYPSGPVKFVTQLAVGTGTDPAMRIVIDQLGQLWGAPTSMINQPSAAGATAARTVAAAEPDGQTLYMAVATTFTVLPELQPNLPFKVSEFVPIGFVGEVLMAILAAPNLPVKSLSELIDLSRATTGGLVVATGGRGSAPHLTTELFRSRSGAALIDLFTHNRAQSIVDVAAGRVPVMVDGIGGWMADGQLKVLAIASPVRLASFPQVATVAETLPGFSSSGWFVLVAPRGTPASIAAKISEDLREIVSRPAIRQKLSDIGVVTRPMTPQEVSDFIQRESHTWAPVARKLRLETK